MEVSEVDQRNEAIAASVSTVAVAVNRKKNCRLALKWALDKFAPEGRYLYKLLHVRPKITTVPTEMGNYIPISNVRDDVASAYKKEIEWQTNEMLLPYKQMCSQKKVEAEAIVIEADDIPAAISDEISKFSISILAIGASSRGMISRKFKGRDISSKISEHAPSFCTVYVISKGRLSSVRTSTSATDERTIDERNDSNFSSSSSCTSSSQTEWSDTSSNSNYFFRSSSLADQRYQALLSINQSIANERSCTIDAHHSRCQSLSTGDLGSSSTCSKIEDGGILPSSNRTYQTDSDSLNSDQANMLDILADMSLSGTQVDITFEVEKLRSELRHAQGMYEIAQNEKNDACQHLNELSRRRIEEALRLEETCLREEKTRELARQEQEKTEAMKQEAELLKESAEREAEQRKEADIIAMHDAEERHKLEKALLHTDQRYMIFTWEEIVSATSSFSDALKIGMGGYGVVYKCSLHHTMAAVKVLHSNEGHWTKQFEQEVEILGRIRHPHLVLLLGACPDRGCLVYEYMEHGSLDDRLFRKNNTPPIPWFERYRVAWEVASALVFLHNSKPKSIVHRDLKPANILLDRNFVSKIGDVGLSTLLPGVNSSKLTMVKDTAPIGTFCYIDPEYQRSGLVSPKSDVYAFGMVILQLLTAKPALALTDQVETALQQGRLAEILDSKAGKWPIEETQELAALGLSCAEIRRRDRPDLKDQVLPMLERLKGIADRARESASQFPRIPPNHFKCPILEDVMDDPVVAADGYTYERCAIDLWLTTNDESPMTNLPMPHKNLLPNYNLLSAITEWNSEQP